MSHRHAHDEAEYARQRTPARLTNVSDLPLFNLSVGVDAPTRAERQAQESPTRRKARVLDALEIQRRDWIDRIHAALVAQLARSHYDGLVSANDARKVFETFPDYDATVDRRFFSALWKLSGWRFADYNGVSDAPGNHGRKIARFRYDPNANESATPSEAA